MTFKISGMIGSKRCLPREEQSFQLSNVHWTHSFVGSGSPTKKVRDSNGNLTILRKEALEEFLSNLLEKGSRAAGHLGDCSATVAWFYENIEEAITECHFLIGLSEEDWTVVVPELAFAWGNDLLVSVSAFGGFSEQATSDVRVLSPEQFEKGEALLLDAPTIKIGELK